MSGQISENPNRQSGTIGPVASAIKDSSNPAMTTNPSGGVGAEWINTTSGEIFLCIDATTNFNVWVGQEGSRVFPARGIFMGGKNAASPSVEVNTIDYVTISTLGNATDFGDLGTPVEHNAATSNGIKGRAVSGGGTYTGSSASVNVLEYVTISTPGDAQDFGDLTISTRQFGATSNASNDRGVFGGGYTGSATTNVIGYITVSSAGNATDFGDCSTVGMQDNSATSSGTNERGLWFGGNRTSMSNVIDYVTISTPGNATDFGDLTQTVSYAAACSNQTNERAVRAGGYVWPVSPNITDVIDYITMSTPGNATDFGDLDPEIYSARGTSDGTEERGLCTVGGYPGGVNTAKIQYITISTPGNAQDFGDLTVARANYGAASDAG